MLLRDSSGRTVEFHLFASSGVDYVNDAINGCNPDIEGKLDADLWVL